MSRSSVPPPGIYTPLVTFFNADSSLDLPAIEAHALRMARGKLVGLVLQGSNGEAVHLDNSERITIIRHVRSVLDSNGFSHVKLIAGAGAPSKSMTLRLAREAKEAGADFALVLPPSYWASAMTKLALVTFFTGVAEESPMPVLVYNFPMVSNGINIDSDTMVELARHPNIVGCKLTDGVIPPTLQKTLMADCRVTKNIGQLHRVATHTDPAHFSVMSGKGEFALHGFVAGASGCIAALVNLYASFLPTPTPCPACPDPFGLILAVSIVRPKHTWPCTNLSLLATSKAPKPSRMCFLTPISRSRS